MPPVLKIYLIYIAVLSVITLILYGIDKIKAINDWYRIPEAVLLSSSLLGGGVGGIVGMLLFRHKTKHWYFFAVNIIASMLHASVLFFFLK